MRKQALRFTGMFVACVLLITGMSYAGGEGAKKKKEKLTKEEARQLETISLSFEVKDGNVEFSWSPATAEPSGGVKLVYSESDDNPQYPFDRYVAWMPGVGHSKKTISNKAAASGKARYYRVCSVEKANHGKFVALSNVVQVPAVEKTEATKAYEQKKAEEKKAKKAEAPKKEKKSEAAGAKTFCPECGTRYSGSEKFCPQDGAKLKPVK